jgi:hypothetical protein
LETTIPSPFVSAVKSSSFFHSSVSFILSCDSADFSLIIISRGYFVGNGVKISHENEKNIFSFSIHICNSINHTIHIFNLLSYFSFFFPFHYSSDSGSLSLLSSSISSISSSSNVCRVMSCIGQGVPSVVSLSQISICGCSSYGREKRGGFLVNT